MTSSSVSNVLQALTLTKSQKMGNAVSGGEEFGIMLDAQTVPEVNVSTDGIFLQNTTAEQLQQSYEKEQTESNYKDLVKINEAKPEKVETEAYEEAYEELETEIKNLLTEKLEVTEEELMQAMEVLGLTFGDLLQGNGLADLMLQLSGGENMTELLFNADFKEVMQELESLLTQFEAETGLTTEELEFVLQQLESRSGSEIGFEEGTAESVELMQQQSDNVTEEEIMMEEANETEASENVTSAENENTVQSSEKVVVTDAAQEETEMTKVTETVNSQNMNQDEMENNQSGEMAQEEQSMDNRSDSSEQKLSKPEQVTVENTQPQQNTYQTVQTTVNTVGEEVVQMVEQTFVDVEDIMNQITEFTRVTVMDTQSSLEMQLNPAHLGKIYLQVVSKDGMITAQISAQNEAVKQVIESQVAILKENLNQQGLKVEAVEVTIASHEFEQNLEGNQQNGAEGQQENGGQKNRRFITLDNLDEMAGLMSEEEKLAARIMLENGNSMDVTAEERSIYGNNKWNYPVGTGWKDC